MQHRAAFFLLLAACSSSPSGGPDAGPDVEAGTGDVLSIGVPPFTLVPVFSPMTHDYYVRCAAGDNPATLVVDTTNGETLTPVDLVPDQALTVANQYWIRCLPPDFPVLFATGSLDGGAPTPGYYLVNSLTYAFVLDTNGTPIWYARGSAVADVDALAKDTITFVPNATLPYGYASTVAFSIKALDGPTTTSLLAVGSPTDLHELRLLPNGDYLLFTYPIEQGVDLTGLSTYGANETMADCKIEEVDPAGNLVWSWLASDHVDPVKESMQPAANMINGQNVIDVFHCNAIDVDAAGNLLLSARHASALYDIDRTSGVIQWKLGGTAYNKDGAALIAVTGDTEGTFSMQHDARFAKTPNHVTMFDDHGAPGAVGVARGVEYALDFGAKTATVAWQYLGTGKSQYEGSFRRYADGHDVIGWGYVPNDPRIVTEVSDDGTDVLDVASSGGASYRAVKVPLTQLDVNVLRKTCPQ
ncbi:MAG TPA: aryl-sulfate sulfotransferase [Polyangiaceae bacterium]|jgi:hypothetical protein